MPAPDSDYDLETIAEAQRYNRWIYDCLQVPPNARVLELGCGIGNLTPLFLELNRNVLAIDIDERLIERLRQKVGARERLETRVAAIEEIAKEQPASFDAVVSSNVLEHISDAEEATVVRSTFALLKPGGLSAHWVPATPAVFGSLDEKFGHHRRYTKQRLTQLFTDAGFRVERCVYWNLIGLAGWWWNARVKKAERIEKSHALLFDRWFVPWVRRVEAVLPLPVGQSLCILARK
jgi:cyclopropane fatty-acyl-phospholipid synthase-like methyltransferase